MTHESKKQITREQLETMTGPQIVQARKEGRLDELMAGTQTDARRQLTFQSPAASTDKPVQQLSRMQLNKLSGPEALAAYKAGQLQRIMTEEPRKKNYLKQYEN